MNVPPVRVSMVNVGPMHEVRKRIWIWFNPLTRAEAIVLGWRLLCTGIRWRVGA